MTLQEVFEHMAARDPKVRIPDPHDVARLQRDIDEAAQRLTPSKAAELARLWFT